MGEQIEGLRVYGAGTYLVELAAGHTMTGRNRVTLHASVDADTGEVRLFVDRADLETVRRIAR